MIKKMIGIIAAVFMSLVFCCGCGDKKFVAFEKTNLETAFNNAWISQEHLKSIAYYYNGEVDEPAFALIPKLQLSEKTVNILVSEPNTYYQQVGLVWNHFFGLPLGLKLE